MTTRDTACVVSTGMPRSPSARQQAFARCADQLTRFPSQFDSHDSQRLRDVVSDEGEVIEALNVIAGFNFANRVADALAIAREVPNWFGVHPKLYSLAFNLMSFAIRWRMNFTPREILATNPAAVLQELETALAAGEMGRPPRYVYRLSPRAYILEQHAVMQRSLLLSDLPKTLVRKVGVLVCALNGDAEWCAEWSDVLGWSRRQIPTVGEAACANLLAWGSSALERNGLRLARQMTLDAAKTTDEEIEALRGSGLGDREVLAFVLVVAGFNAANRLNLAFDAASSNAGRPTRTAVM